jgi:hypothetical protein
MKEGVTRSSMLPARPGRNKTAVFTKNPWLDDSPVGRYGSAREKEYLDLHPFKEEL